MKISFIVFLFIVLWLSGVVIAAEEAVIHRSFKLYEGSFRDYFFMEYPIQLNNSGQIKVEIKVKEPYPIEKNQVYINISNYSSSNWNKWVSNPDDIYPTDLSLVKIYKKVWLKENSITIIHNVDTHEISNTNGRYTIRFMNRGNFQVEGTFKITYPGSIWNIDRAVLKYNDNNTPDLAIKNVSLNKNNLLQVKVVNYGKGLYTGFWHLKKKDAVYLTARVGNNDIELALPIFDPKKNLKKENGEIGYVFKKLKIDNKTDVRVSIDKYGIVMDSNRNNNVKDVTLGKDDIKPVKPIQQNISLPKLPDLKVSSITLDDQNRITVEIENTSDTGIDAANWSNDNQLYLNIKVDGNSWVNVYLNDLDPDKKLTQENSKISYITGFQLQKISTVKAFIDEKDVLKEINEDNNIMEVTLQP